DLVEGVAGECEGRQAQAAGSVEQGAGGLGLLERLAAGKRDALDAVRAGQLANELVERDRAAAGGIVGGRVEAAGAAERAALEPDDEARAGAVGAAPGLERVDPDVPGWRSGGCHLPGLGKSGAGRSPADEPARSSSLNSRSGVTMPLSMPLDGTKPSSVPPDSRSWSWLSVAARKL